MRTILMINETFLLLPNQSLSMEYKQLSCLSDMKVWLIVHFMTSRFIEYALIIPLIFSLNLILILFFFDYWKRMNDLISGNWRDIWELDRISLLIIVIKKELKLILIYVYIVFFYTWLQVVSNNHRITYFNCLRWFIEASYLPQTVFFTGICYCLCIDDFFSAYNLHYRPMIAMKVPLFILMRYAEIQSDFFVNRLQIYLFNICCYNLQK